MPQLQHDLAAAAMHFVSDGAPALDLFLGVNAGRVEVALAQRTDLGAFGHNQAGGGALAVILGSKRRGHLTGDGAVTRQRGHDHAVGKIQRAQAHREEQGGFSGFGHQQPVDLITRQARRRVDRGAP